MTLPEQIERAFAQRGMPAEPVEKIYVNQEYRDSDVDDARWFKGRDWHDISSDDWKEHDGALCFFCPEAFRYYLPSLLTIAVQAPDPDEPILSVCTIVDWLYRSPNGEPWQRHFIERFIGFSDYEFQVIREWLPHLSHYER